MSILMPHLFGQTLLQISVRTSVEPARSASKVSTLLEMFVEASATYPPQFAMQVHSNIWQREMCVLLWQFASSKLLVLPQVLDADR
jgi:hypothetical protein